MFQNATDTHWHWILNWNVPMGGLFLFRINQIEKVETESY